MSRVDSEEVRVYVNDLEPEHALKIYDTFTRYLAYENTIFWTRSQHFLVAHAALLGFFAAAAFGKGQVSSPHIVPLLPTLICAVGLALSFLWHRALTTGDYWTGHWMDILKELESKATGEIPAFREFTTDRRYVSGKGVARQCAWLFSGVWTLGIIYALAC